GTFELNNTRFILSAEVEDKNRVHHLLYFPCISSVESFKEKIKSKSKNLETDGRPNINLNGEELASIAKDFEILIGAAHVFTPWTAMYAYHNSLKDCYGDLTDYVSFIELGLSADTDFADRIQELHRLTFLTNSDSHSPHPVRLAREFNRFEVKDVSFEEIKKAILRIGGNKPVLNVGLPPQEGKYHESACISCFTHYTLDQAQRRHWKCSCGKRIKKGVKDRIYEIADLKESIHPKHRPPYIHLIPLAEIITKAIGQQNPFTQTVNKRWNELVTAFKNEINVLIDENIHEISKVTVPAITEAILAFREKKVVIRPGGGGQYGSIELPKKNIEFQNFSLQPKDKQTSLLEY
ncbi:MAG: endonuclease Q family protein, partial [Candidatus Thermoplasmatota archaeon]|nr:endonuclease Q family protein [Candidatus Thermoplasmatota archaeon]